MVLNTVGSITGLSCRCMHDDVRGPRPRVAIYWHARAKRTLVRLRDRMSYGLQTQAHTISNPNKMHQCGHKHALKEKHHHFRCSICYFNLLDRANLQIRSHRIFEYWNGKVSFYFHQIHHKCKMYLGVRTELQIRKDILAWPTGNFFLDLWAVELPIVTAVSLFHIIASTLLGTTRRPQILVSLFTLR